MAGRIWPNIGVFGSSGSGKSTFSKDLIGRLISSSQPEFVVIVNNSRELSEFAFKTEYLGVQKAASTFDPKKLADFIRHYKRVHFEVDAPSPVKFMDALAQAIKSLGQYDARRMMVLFVADEAHKFLSKAVVTKSQAVQSLDFEARKYGIVLVKITPRIKGTSQDMLSVESRTQCRQVYIFPFNQPIDREAVQEMGLPDPIELAYPDEARNLPPEYFAADMTKGKVIAMKRRPDGSRYEVPLTGAAAQAQSPQTTLGGVN